MNLLFWNVRGLGRGERCISIRKLIHRRKLSLVGLWKQNMGDLLIVEFEECGVMTSSNGVNH